MKRLLSTLTALLMLLSCLPGSAFAAAKQMRDGVPVWTEDTVKQYALDFIHGQDMERLFGYYDLQIRRYMPMDTYTGMLSEIEWMTGEFLGFGTYTSFEETELKTKTHVLHLCMEKQDLDLYFTHKNKTDDWEVMAVEFVPGEKQDVAVAEAAEEDTSTAPAYTETAVQVGTEPYLLTGVLTLPASASSLVKVPGVVLVQDASYGDADETVGQTKLFADLAKTFAQKGIATLRYQTRMDAYGSTFTQEQLDGMTAEDEVIQDAIAAGKLLAENDLVDASHLVILGHGLGAMLAPRIASEADGLFQGMVLVAGSPKSLEEVLLAQKETALANLDGSALVAAQGEAEALSAEIDALSKVKKADAAKALTLNGRNAYYYWEMDQVDACKLIKKLKLPTFIVQGNDDYQLSLEDGIEAYEDQLETASKYVDFKIFRKLNHQLMLFAGPSGDKGTLAEYDTPATLNTQAGRTLADWVLDLGQDDEE